MMTKAQQIVLTVTLLLKLLNAILKVIIFTLLMLLVKLLKFHLEIIPEQKLKPD